MVLQSTFHFSAKDDRDFVEIYCGDARKRYLGYLIDESESRTIDVKAENNKPPIVDKVDEPVANSTKQATPRMVSDMGKCFIYIYICECDCTLCPPI